jgi:D-alanyl-D-alanine carboxypeptidase
MVAALAFTRLRLMSETESSPPAPPSSSSTRRWRAMLSLLVLVAGCAEAEPEPEPNLPVEEQLLEILDRAVDQPAGLVPGAIAHYRDPAYRPWSGAAGWGDTQASVLMRPHDKLRAGSIIKTFLAVVALQHVEEGSLELESTLPELLPSSTTDRIAAADSITLRMLLSHTSGIPDWVTPAAIGRVASDPGYVWSTDEQLDLAAEQVPMFEPGASWGYSNTNYTIVGLVLDELDERGWRAQVRERVIEPLELHDTELPEPGDPSIAGDHAHGYEMVEGATLDITYVDPSMAGAAGGSALVTTDEDLGRFLAALLDGEMFAHDATLTEMTTMVDAPDTSGLPHSYGLGIESYMLPDGLRVVGHGGSTAGYATMMFQAPQTGTTIVTSINSGDLAAVALEVLIPAFETAFEG